MERHQAGSKGLAYFGGMRHLYAMYSGWRSPAAPEYENKKGDYTRRGGFITVPTRGFESPRLHWKIPPHDQPAMWGDLRSLLSYSGRSEGVEESDERVLLAAAELIECGARGGCRPTMGLDCLVKGASTTVMHQE